MRMDYFPEELMTNLFQFSSDKDKPFNDRLEQMGQDSHNTINNIGSIFYFIVLNLFLILASIFIPYLNFWTHYMNLMFTFYEGYIEIVISSYLNASNKIYYTLGDKISYIFGYVLIFVSLLILPMYFLYIANLSPKKLMMESTSNKFGIFYENISMKRKGSLYYNLFFILRRLFFVVLLFAPALR